MTDGSSKHPADRPGDRLAEYRRKRTASATPEPFGGARVARPRLFVVQKHRATALHFDLRLEWNGVLLSWAVPKGPSPNPEVKRLAMQTEDHPVEYADFEGTIPKDNYGAGEVIVWDQGAWVPLDDPEAGMKNGKLLFELKGHKLRGVWTLFRTNKKDGDGRQWLLMKKPDVWAEEEEDANVVWPEASVLSGLTLKELKDGPDRAVKLAAELEAEGVPHGAVHAGKAKVMLAKPEAAPFSSAGWIYELKFDGYRLVCESRDGEPVLAYRSGRDATRLFPEVARAVRMLPYRSVVLDGEVVVLDDEARPRFQRLQKRGQAQAHLDIELGCVRHPVVVYCFDCLAVEGYDLRGLPLSRRKEILKRILPPHGTLRYADHVEEKGKELFEQIRAQGLEGVMAKKVDGAYRGGRHDTWLKFKAEHSGDFVIVGWTAPKGTRVGLGALHLAAFDGNELTYIGRVGTGFGDRMLEELLALLEPCGVDEPPCTGPVPRTRGNFWVRPDHVCEVRYLHRTADGLLRHPSFLRLRDDKEPEECLAPVAHGDEPELAVTEAGADTHSGAEEGGGGSEPASSELRFVPTNLTKVFWPDEGFTKGDLIDYYRAIAPRLLPFLRDRPVVLVRYPDGIRGKNFFQKDAPQWTPGWVRTERMWSEQTQRDIDYFLCDDEESLAYLANLGAIPLHVWSSRVTDPARPDWCVLDLDPKAAPFTDVVKIACAARKLCDEIGLPCFAKTSGSTGLHILFPLAGQCTYDQSRALGEVVARVLEAELPDIATTARTRDKRGGKVYLDYLQNGQGRLIVAPYSVRPLPGAPVSMPLKWAEVNPDLEPRQFTIRNAPARLDQLETDPLHPVLTEKPDLAAVLAALSGRF